MLKPAKKYWDEITDKIEALTYHSKFKYFTLGSYFDFSKPEKNDHWAAMDYVSVNQKGDLLGYIEVGIQRDSRNISSLIIANLTPKPSLIFSRDVLKLIHRLFTYQKFSKITFKVAVEHSANKMYQKWLKLMGGRLVGTLTKHVRLPDGLLHDIFIYEIMREDYERQWKNTHEIIGVGP